MRNKKTVVCVFGTRPEVIKMSSVIHALRKKPGAFDVHVVATAQHRELLDQMLKVFHIKPDLDMNLMRRGQTLADITARVIVRFDRFLADVRPDMVLAQGDTTTVMAVASACFYRNVPLGHVEAGLRTYDLQHPYPEEFNRRVVSLVATHHFAPTQSAAQYLRQEGVATDAIRVTGNTGIDALFYTLSHTSPSGEKPFSGRSYVLMTCHRREIFGKPIATVFRAVRDFFRRHRDVSLWFPVHPNPEVSGPAHKFLTGLPNILLTPPLDYVDFVHAMNGAKLVLTDSGGVQEEAPALGKPVLVLRDVTERPEGVETGACYLVGPHREAIHEHLERLLFDQTDHARTNTIRSPYGDGQAADRIVAFLSNRPIPDWSGT